LVFLSVTKLSGDLTLAGMTTGIAELQFVSGSLTIDSTCTGGSITVTGDGYLVDNSGPGCTVVSHSMTKNTIWNESVSDHTTAGSMGQAALFQLYNDGRHVSIHVDMSGDGTAGTVLGVNGTPDNPCATDVEAKTLYTALGISAVTVHGFPAVLTTSHSNVDFYSVADIAILDFGSQDISGCYFHAPLTTEGILGAGWGGTWYGAVIQYAEKVQGLGYDNILTGSITVETFLSLRNPSTGFGSQFVDLEPLGAATISFSGATGRYKLVNQTGAATSVFDFTAGQLTIDSTCTAGTVTVRGNVQVIDNSAAGCVVDVSGVQANLTTDAVWDEYVSDHTTLGTTGEAELLALYNDGERVSVYLDTTSGTAGAVLGVNGTVRNPCLTDTDAKTVYTALGVKVLSIVSSNTTLTTSHSGVRFFPAGDNPSVAINGQDVSNCDFLAVPINGVAVGAFIAKDSSFGITSGYAGVHWNCFVYGTIGVAGSGFLIDGFSTNSVTFDLVAGVIKLIRFGGPVVLTNLTTGISICSFVGGSLTIDNTCTGGTVTVSGNVEVIDNSGSGCTVDVSSVQSNLTTDAVWDGYVSDHITVGTTGRAALLKLYDGLDGKGPAVYYDGKVSNTGTVLGVDGTLDNPVSSEASMRTIGDVLGIKRCVVGSIAVLGQELTLSQAYLSWVFDGNKETGSWIELNGKNVDLCQFEGLSVMTSTVQDGFATFINCQLNHQIDMQGLYKRCILHGTMSIKAGGFARIIDCVNWNPEDVASQRFDMNGTGSLHATGLDGFTEIRNLTAGGTVELASSQGALVQLTSTCTGGDITLAGAIELDDQSNGPIIDISRLSDSLVSTRLTAAHGAGSWESATSTTTTLEGHSVTQMNATPGQAVIITTQVMDASAERIDGYVPQIDYIIDPTSVMFTGYPVAMIRMAEGVYSSNVDIPVGISAVGTYIVSVSYNRPGTILTQYEVFLINVALAFGNSSVSPL